MKSEVLCPLILFLVFHAGPTNSRISCPEVCFCNHDFTDCKQNDLETLPEGIDLNISSLDISHNKFKTLPQKLNTFPNLRNLNISYNQLSGLGDTAFLNLVNLQQLDLSFNKFSEWSRISLSAFSSLKNLTFLDLSHNPLLRLVQLRIGSLQVLRLNNCSMRKLNAETLGGLPNIKELHISQNPIGFIDVSLVSNSLKFLDLRECNLNYIAPNALSKLTSLQTVWLNGNINLRNFPCDSSSLLFLDLSDCNLESIPNGTLPKVYSANFHGNHFRNIPKYSFNTFTELKTLDLSNNTISFIDEEAFVFLKDVERIDLSLNTLSSISSTLFRTNTKLHYLNMSHNYFNRLEPLVTNSLQVLDVSSCEIQSVNKQNLQHMLNLKMLNMSKNVISEIPDYMIGNNLQDLDLSLCRIKSVNNYTFASMSFLSRLNLAGNRLTTVYPDCFYQVNVLEITDNPWRCDCVTLKEMYSWLSKTGKWMDNLICESPQEFESLTWLQACQSEWEPAQARKDSIWWYTTSLIVAVFAILFLVLFIRRIYVMKEKRRREEDEVRRTEEREALRRMRRLQLEVRENSLTNAPDPRDLQTPPSYNEALLMPRLDASHPSLSGSLHSVASKRSFGNEPDVVAGARRIRPRRKRRRRKSVESGEGGQQRASRIADTDDTSDHERETRPTLESDF